MSDFDKVNEMSEYGSQEQTRSNLEDPASKTYGDRMFEQYELLAEYDPENDIPSDDLLPHDTRVTQSLSDDGSETEEEPASFSSEADLLDEAPLPDVPDADEIQPGSPPDPSAPDVDIVHGTDLLNGAGADEDNAPPQGWFTKQE